MTMTDGQNRVLATWDGINKSVYLLGGFALENAIKSFLVYENPHWISNGSLSRRLRSHSLTSLQKQSALIPFKRQHLIVLQEFEDSIESWARYPCALSVADSMDQRIIRPTLWNGYIKLMSAYGKRLQKMLSGAWNGPHGFYGRWTFRGNWLSSD